MNAVVNQLNPVSVQELGQIEGGTPFQGEARVLYLAIAVSVLDAYDMLTGIGRMMLPEVDPWK